MTYDKSYSQNRPYTRSECLENIKVIKCVLRAEEASHTEDA